MAKDSMSTILLLGGGALAVYGYSQGWFDNLLAKFGAGSAPAPSDPAAAKAAADAAALAAAQATAAALPGLGTKVTTVAQILAQAAAKDAYILPDWTVLPSATTASPAGYSQFILTDYPQGVFLRQDVAQQANSIVGSLGKQISLADLQKGMSSVGLTGLGDYQQYMATRTGRVLPFRYA